MSITLELDEQALASLPLGPGERERHMQIELACRHYAHGWLSTAQATWEEEICRRMVEVKAGRAQSSGFEDVFERLDRRFPA